MSADTKFFNAVWSCRECPAGGEYANAHGVAARHHKSTGHEVIVRETREYVYGGDDLPLEKEWTWGESPDTDGGDA